MTENPNKHGKGRPWVRFERDYPLVTVHISWYTNDQGQRVLAIEDDASQFVFNLIETDSQSAAQSVDLLDDVRAQYESSIPIVEVITEYGTEFVNPQEDDRPCLDHTFERYL